MTLVRIYLPLTVAQLRELADTRAVAGSLPGFAVTESVRRSDPSAGQEEWEYAALQDAAAHALDQGGPVIVAAADIDLASVDDRAAAGSAVLVAGPLRLPRVGAFHVGDDVTGSAHAADLDPDSEVELSWYDTSELEHLVSLV